MGEENSLEILRVASRMSGLSPDAAVSLNALTYRIAQARIEPGESGRPSEEDAAEQAFLEKARKAKYLD